MLDSWWADGFAGCDSSFPTIAAASNLVSGGNPVYQVSDFLAFYPKFGVGLQGVQALAVAAGGTGYSVNDVLTLVQPDASGATAKVLTVSGGGAILTAQLTAQGSGYSLGSGIAVTGGTGTGATFNITAVTPTSLLAVPPIVMQTYINLATSSLSIKKWGANWPFGMALFIAHFITLYLSSEGNAGSTPGAVARSGLAKGIIVSSSAGDVSKTIEPPDLGEFAGTWGLTVYGQQLATIGMGVGQGVVYVFG